MKRTVITKYDHNIVELVKQYSIDKKGYVTKPRMDFSSVISDKVKITLDNSMCMGCLKESNDLHKVANELVIAWYYETVEMPMHEEDTTISLSLCRDCVMLIEKIIDFKSQVRQAHAELIKCKIKNECDDDEYLHSSSTHFESVVATAVPVKRCHGDVKDEEVMKTDETNTRCFLESDNIFTEELRHSDDTAALHIDRETKSTSKKHEASAKCASDSRPRHRCDVCAASFARPSQAAAHRRVHTGERPYTCGQCHAAFRQIQHLRTHYRTHTGERPYKCVTCDASFKLQQHLVKHTRIHTGEKPYACGECDAAFRQQAALVSHRRIHTGDKPYQCDTCGRSFRVRSALTAHMSIHTGIKRYKCDLCDAAFGTSTILKVHRRVHTCERPYTCEKCGLAFKQLGDMKAHRRSKHSL